MRLLPFLPFAATAAGAVDQKPFNSLLGHLATVPSFAVPHNASESTVFKPFDHLIDLSASEFTALGHPVFPHYKVRIKKSRFCDGTVNAYTGYIDVEARHLFFYFFESRSDPDTDDVIFWTNGGPGGSSSTGLFMELGPCRVVNSTTTTFNPYGWNDKANVFFIDQPIGVGFSYADYGEAVSNTLDAAKDISAFVAIFFENFSKYKGRAFHMAGESYGLPRCQKWMKEACVDQLDDISCMAAWMFCETEISNPLEATGLNPYDITKPCGGPIADVFCYPINKEIKGYLSRPDVRSTLGVDESVPQNFSLVSWEVNSAFMASMDHVFPNQFYIAALLERGIRALIYTGVNDFACNWVGNDRMTRDMEWTGREAFFVQPLRDWLVDGKVAGQTRSAGPLTFATINDAGHMVGL
ncbi:hypothetical protease S10 [Postia placenta Mad-698-R]|nr:hypothetical protease S10 [Postia placenta Mad-698-R]